MNELMNFVGSIIQLYK